MAWKKYFTTVPSQARITARLEELNRDSNKGATSQKFSSYLPEVYAGAPNRIERYVAYDQADLDSEINRSLDTIAEFCTQNQSDDDPIPFRFIWKGDVTETEVELLKGALQQWSSINKLNKRIFKIFRNTIKYGDQFFIRDPETYELLWVDSAKVEKIIVNEAKGKQIEQYVIRDLDFNLQSLVATNPMVHDQYSFPGGYPRSANPASGAGNINYGQPTTPGGRTSRFYNPANSMAIDANHVVHLSLSEGLDQYWPFGTSVIEAVYKTYKQKDLLEDCILIYRIVRAPERRVFKIDVGQLQGQRAMQYVERVKNEIYQRRLPNRTGGGSTILDTAYNPISITEDIFLATNSEQRGTTIDTLPGGENLGCFSLDTKIKLLDGRDVSIADIAEEMKSGKQLWTYSCHPVTGEIGPGKITWAGKTRTSAQVMKLTLDSGESIICTPDHKFPLRGIGFVEAKDLTVGQSLLALYTRNTTISEHKKLDYTQYFDHIDEKWVYTHRMVAKHVRSAGQHQEMLFDSRYAGATKDVIHHVDHNRYNNNPENLAWMNWHDHGLYHSAKGFTPEAQKKGTLAAAAKLEKLRKDMPEQFAQLREKQIRGRARWRSNLSQNCKTELNQKIGQGIRNSWKDADESTREMLLERGRKNGQQSVRALQMIVAANPNYWAEQGPKISLGQERSRALFPEKWAMRSEKIRHANFVTWEQGRRDHVHVAQKFTYTAEMMRLATLAYRANPKFIADLCKDLNANAEFVQEWNTANSTKHNQSKFKKFGYQHLCALLGTFGMDWNKFRVVNNNIVVDSTDAVMQNVLQLVQKSNSQEDFARISGMSRYQMLKAAEKYNLSDYGMIKSYAENMNHRIVSIEYLTETMDVGTLTVDGDEELHNWHTYALSVGVFVKNSIDDLKYFNNKLLRGLGIPSSYLPSGPDDGTAVYNDGKVGTAFIQEYRFNKYCQRLQTALAPTMDMEFKLFLKFRGIEVHSSLFELAFNVPQSFSEYRNMALDTERVNLFSSVMNSDANKYMSKRYALGRYLGWTEEDILDNERMWKEENSNKVKGKTGTAPVGDQGVGLGAIGIRPGPEPEFGAPPAGEEEFAAPPATETPAAEPAGGETPAPTTP